MAEGKSDSSDGSGFNIHKKNSQKKAEFTKGVHKRSSQKEFAKGVHKRTQPLINPNNP